MTRRPTRHPTRGDRGQSTVELALALPLLCVLLLGVVQVGLVVRHQLAVQAAARNGARAAAAAASTGAATSAALASTPLRPLDVDIVDDGSTVTVTVRYVDHTDVPLVGLFIPAVTVSASATMTLEPP